MYRIRVRKPLCIEIATDYAGPPEGNDIPLINDCFKIDSFKSNFILNERDDEIVPVGWKAFSLLKSERNSNAISQVYVIWRKLYQKRFIQKSLDACDVTTQNLLTSMYRISLTAVKACNCFRLDQDVVPADDNFFPGVYV